MNDRLMMLYQQAHVVNGQLTDKLHVDKFAELIIKDVIEQITIVKSKGEVVAVTLTDEDHQIQKVIWQKEIGDEK